MQIGANYLSNSRCEFTVWAPEAESLKLKLIDSPERLLPMVRREHGYWQTLVEDVSPDTRYLFRIDGEKERPDPASCHQPEGVHGPSQVVDHSAFKWSDGAWHGLPLEALIIYELHVGTFTPEGTFDALIPRLPELRRLGITAVELMPVAQFPGERNWGYDGTYPFAVQQSYGGPDGLKRLIDACHREGLAVVLDVVYNHLGHEGNYLWDYGPYFTDRYHTPWGGAFNFDGPHSDQVRRYFIQNAHQWFHDYHVDALRLDAVHAIYDFSARPFLQELAEEAHRWTADIGRSCQLIAESDLNDVRLIRPTEIGGFGLDGQWSDDFHHALHTLLTGESQGYYEDFGRIDDLARTFRDGFAYAWRYSRYRQCRHGSSAADRPGRQLVVCSQNHDQIGNRMLGERLLSLAGFEAAKLAAAAVLSSPFVPLLFMGEEYAEEAPFLYFVDFSDPELMEEVRRGRKEEFSAFNWKGEPPDPGDAKTFGRSILRWENRGEDRHRAMLDYYRRLIELRRTLPPLAALDKERLETGADEERKIFWLRRWRDEAQLLILLSFDTEPATLPFPGKAGTWEKLLDSAETNWRGPGAILPERAEGRQQITAAPQSCAFYRLES